LGSSGNLARSRPQGQLHFVAREPRVGNARLRIALTPAIRSPSTPRTHPTTPTSTPGTEYRSHGTYSESVPWWKTICHCPSCSRQKERVRRQSAPWPLPPIAFPLEGGSACLFAAKHLLDVGSLSGRARASRIRLITSRHSLLPASCPAPPWAFLAVGLPRTEGGRAGTTLASEEGREDRARLGPERSRPARAELGAGEERSGSTLGQAEVRGFHVPLQKSTRG